MNPSPQPEPEPDSDFTSEEERIRAVAEREERVASLAKGALNFLLLAGGAAAVAAMIVPTRTAGASRTAFLDWQNREKEIERAIAATTPPATSTAVDSPAP